MVGEMATLVQSDSRDCASNLVDEPAHSPESQFSLLDKTLETSVSRPATLRGLSSSEPS